MRDRTGYVFAAAAAGSLVLGMGIAGGMGTGRSLLLSGLIASMVLGACLLIVRQEALHPAPPVDALPDRQDRFVAMIMLALWVGIMGLAYGVDRGLPDPSSVAGLQPWGYDLVLGPDGLAGDAIRAEFARFMAAVPPDAAWNERALLSLGCGVVGFLLFGLLMRLLSDWRWAATASLALVFSFGVHQSGKALTFVEIPHMTCDDYTRAAGSGEFLTSGDMQALSKMWCPLPRGFRMDRAVRAPS